MAAVAQEWTKDRSLPGFERLRPDRTELRRDVFDMVWYGHANPDVRSAGMDLGLHYRLHGAREGRWPSPWIDPLFFVKPGRPPLDARSLLDLAAVRDGATSAFFCGGRLGRGGKGSRPVSVSAFHQALRNGETVGHVDLCTRGFMAGWLTGGGRPGEAPAVELYLNGRWIGRAGADLFRPDIDVRVKRRCCGFLLTFPEPLRDGDLMELFAQDGTPLVGSPFVFESALAIPASEPGSVCIERLPKQIPRGPVRLSGWAIMPHGARELRILVDGKAAPVSVHDRWDLRTLFSHTPAIVGWEAVLDLSAAPRHQREVSLAVEIDGRTLHASITALSPAEPPRREPLTLFMHIPKTAGTSLTRALDLLEDRHTYWFYDRANDTIAQQRAALSPAAARFESIDIVGGHFAYGFHDGIERACRYVSFLREPTEWLRSYFFYVRDVRRDPGFADLDLADALSRRLDPMFDNPFTRFFAGSSCDTVGEADLDRAVANLDRHFAFVGLVERMEESTARLGALLGCRLTVRHDNRGLPSQGRGSHDEERFLALAASCTHFDRRLYQHCLDRFWSDGTPRSIAASCSR